MLRQLPAELVPPLTYFTGVHNQNIAAAAGRRNDIGLLITPLQPRYAKFAHLYPVIAVDNGVFSRKTPFSESKFLDLLDRVSPFRSKIRFVVAPDVVGNAQATLERFLYWEPLLHDRGFPVAFVGQDGVEHLPIPWDRMDVFSLAARRPGSWASMVRRTG